MVARPHDNLDIAAALRVVAHDDTVLDGWRNVGRRHVLERYGIEDELVLEQFAADVFHDVFLIKLRAGNEFFIQVQAILDDVEHKFLVSVLVLQEGIQFFALGTAAEMSARHAVVVHEFGVVCSGMVGSEEEQIIAFPDFCVERLEQFGNLLVEREIDFVNLLSARAIFMTYIIGG